MGFVDTQVQEGRYSNASDVIRAALRLLGGAGDQDGCLRAALIEGEESGQSTPFDFEAFIARKRNGHAQARMTGRFVLTAGESRLRRNLGLHRGSLGTGPGGDLHPRPLATY